MNPRPLHWQCGILAGGLPGKSLKHFMIADFTPSIIPGARGRAVSKQTRRYALLELVVKMNRDRQGKYVVGQMVVCAVKTKRRWGTESWGVRQSLGREMGSVVEGIGLGGSCPGPRGDEKCHGDSDALGWPDVTQRRGTVSFVPKTSRHVVAARHCVVEVVV